MTALFDTVLVANRGEVAVRVMRTLGRLGVKSVAVYSAADADALHVESADVAVPIFNYLDIKRIVDAAVSTGADAIHPGYGFLAENPAFAAACVDAGIVFIGPWPEAIEVMGDKIAAKEMVAAAGVRVVPGGGARGMDDAAIIAVAQGIGAPLLLKPSAGGGGKGMRLVRDLDGLPEAVGAARREAQASFGDDTLLVERFIERPRHIEIQVVADQRGNVVHLGERECSLQRRHQKIIEEAPSALLTAQQRATMGAAAIDVARAVGYTGVGTVEFIVPGDSPSDFYFMEMNTRLQVEHPVTELITGADLVEMQLRIAAGDRWQPKLDWDDVQIVGHAIEARVYAEDPNAGFLPSAGPILSYHVPAGDHVRVDSGVRQGDRVGVDYDPMLAKVIVRGADRASALRDLDAALADTAILGVRTNIGFLRRLIADEEVLAGRLDTGLVERHLDQLTELSPSADAITAAALVHQLRLEPEAPTSDLFASPTGWRIGAPAWTRWTLQPPHGDPVVVSVRRVGERLHVGDDEVTAVLDGDDIIVDGMRWRWAQDGHTTWVSKDGIAWDIRDLGQAGRLRTAQASTAGPIVAPMPGTVTDVRAAVGDQVVAGQPLVVVEAMKMEHVLVASADGVVSEVHARQGQSVAIDQILVIVEDDR